MSISTNEYTYLLKKVGKFWLLCKSGGNFKKCTQLTNAKEVDITDNFVVADETVYEIKEGENGHHLVKVEEISDNDEDNSNTQYSTGLIHPIQDSTKYDSHRDLSLSYQEEACLEAKPTEVMNTAGVERSDTEDLYYLYEAGQTEDVNTIDDDAAGSIKGASGISRQFTWSTRTNAVRVFQTYENVTVKVYSSDIVYVPVDCIVIATNTNLKHGGGITKAIANAAGRDLIQEGRDYLKQHGRLKGGETCITNAGNMSYKYVIHAVGPCWSDYKPFALRDIERCETDLYHTVINSLNMAENLNMETIALSSISSGIYGCPQELCSVQYATAVIDYTGFSRSPLKEIHFVDTNMEMLKVLHETFEKMIPGGCIPRSYCKLKYVEQESPSCKFKERTFVTRDLTNILDEKDTETYQEYKGKPSGQVLYPYCYKDYPPGHAAKEFACCFGPGQNLYVYSADILSMTRKDMVVFGINSDGKIQGHLAHANSNEIGKLYQSETTKAFAKNHEEGTVVVCSAANLKNFKWVTYAILHKNKRFIKEERKEKVKYLYQNIFDAMRSKHCNSTALSLIGTEEGYVDPEICGQVLFEALGDLAFVNKTYYFDIHLVCKRTKEIENIISIIEEAYRNTHLHQRKTYHRAERVEFPDANAKIRPKFQGIISIDNHGQNENICTGNKHNWSDSNNIRSRELSRQSESRTQLKTGISERERFAEEDLCLTIEQLHDMGKDAHLRKTFTNDEGKTEMKSMDITKTKRDVKIEKERKDREFTLEKLINATSPYPSSVLFENTWAEDCECHSLPEDTDENLTYVEL